MDDDEVKEREKRIAELEKQRKKELENRRWMASCPDRKNSYGYTFERKVNEKFDKMIGAVRKDIDSSKRSAIEPVSPDDERRRPKRRRGAGHKVSMLGSKHSEEEEEDDEYAENDDDGSVESSFSYVSNKSTRSDEGGDDFIASDDEEDDGSSDGSDEDYAPAPRVTRGRKRQQTRNQEVIELDDSDSYSDASCGASRDGSACVDGSSVHNNDSISLGEQQDPDASACSDAADEMRDDGSLSPGEPGNAYSGDAENYPNEANEEDEVVGSDSFFEDDASDEIERYHVSKVRESKLTMATQGFRCQAIGGLSTTADESNRASNRAVKARDFTPFDPASVNYQGKTFRKNRCYVLKEGDVIVGIKRFISNDIAECVLVERFDDTLLGIEEEGLEYRADHELMGALVQIYNCVESLELAKLERESEVVTDIPRLIYQPQTPGDWHTFGYFYDRNEMQRKGKREGMRSLEVFAGCGGSLLGYKNSNFETVMAIENGRDAVLTLKENHKGLKIYEGCVRKFIEQDFDTLKCALGRTDHIHFSSPCQDFSKANRHSQAAGSRDRADLSLLLIDLVRKTSCSTAVFENVVGIWMRKNIHYLKNIALGLLKLGYQVRCTVLRACDYGDPQGRPRFFMFIAKNNVPMPSFPAKTHGSDDVNLWPYTTVRDSLSRVADDDSLPNMEGRTTQLTPGQHGIVRLMPYDIAPTIRANGGTPFHYSEDRCINVREAACLQSFPLDYRFHGSLGSQYRQIGNAVPVELSTAVAQSIRQVLLYDYEEDHAEEE